MARKKPAPETEPVMVRMQPELIARIDRSRRRFDDLPSRPEVIRRVVTAWLEEVEKSDDPK